MMLYVCQSKLRELAISLYVCQLEVILHYPAYVGHGNDLALSCIVQYRSVLTGSGFAGF